MKKVILKYSIVASVVFLIACEKEEDVNKGDDTTDINYKNKISFKEDYHNNETFDELLIKGKIVDPVSEINGKSFSAKSKSEKKEIETYLNVALPEVDFTKDLLLGYVDSTRTVDGYELSLTSSHLSNSSYQNFDYYVDIKNDECENSEASTYNNLHFVTVSIAQIDSVENSYNTHNSEFTSTPLFKKKLNGQIRQFSTACEE